MAWWIWVILGFVLLALEMLTIGVHVGFFALGAFSVGALVALDLAGPLWVQLMLFALISCAGLFLARPIILKRLRIHTKEVDSFVGEQARAVSDIAVEGIGKAEMRGSAWNARNVGSTPISAGQRCSVEQVQGLTILIRAN